MPGPAAGAGSADRGARVVTLGRIVGLFGVHGWVKVYSHTRPRDAILRYSPWLIGRHGDWQGCALLAGRTQGRGIVAQLAGCTDRDAAAALVGAEIAVTLAQLPRTAAGEYYWAELEGLRVRNLAGADLGAVSHLFETGANDVMVVVGERERLIPFTADAVRRVDLEAGVVEVDWDVED